MKARVLMIPGLWNSGPQHWQTAWERQNPDYSRIMQRDWEHPVCDEWTRTVDTYLRSLRASAGAGQPVVLVGHSLGCATIVHWANRYGAQNPDSLPVIRGAMLVGPSDVQAPSYPKEASGFEPMPLQPLPFRSTVIASSNDPFVTLERARLFADTWGSKFVCIGDAGHINADSGYGPWPKGKQYLEELLG